ncbi:MAG: LysR substrate-binding domain-containing protein [Erythrobacter sp.]|jgi:DNA-binding transcriptional LysR family regulator|nr:LysR substrate-binding domain-containing protein [Erythrobacter sp.]
MLESRRLRHFLAVYELGSIGRACEKLLLTQPALSKSIRQLEDELGVRLFDRTPMGVVPTVFGNALARHAKAIEVQFRNAEAQIQSLKGKAQGHVTVGIGPSVARNILPVATRTLHNLQPEIALTVIEGLVDDLLPRLRRGELDLIVGSWPPIADPMFITETVLVDRLEVVARAGHPLAGKPVLRSELLNYPWALPPASQKWRQALDDLFLERALDPPKAQVVSNSAGYLEALIRSSDHISFLPRQLLDVENDDGLVTLDVEMETLEPEISMSFRERALLDASICEVVQVLRSIGADFTG